VSDVQISPLVADIMQASLKMTHDVNDRLIASLQAQVAELRAREKAVEHGVTKLLSGPWMPTPDALIAALYPSAEYVKAFYDEDAERYSVEVDLAGS
jgi:hypothetical protein